MRLEDLTKTELVKKIKEQEALIQFLKNESESSRRHTEYLETRNTVLRTRIRVMRSLVVRTEALVGVSAREAGRDFPIYGDLYS